jgi:hypothetical protein
VAELVIIPAQGRENWRGKFGNRTLITTQSVGSGGLLTECLGPLQFNFRLRAKNGALHFQQANVRLRVGRLRVPIPAWAAPKVSAICAGLASPSRVHITVGIVAPLLGLLLSYEGDFEREELTE